MGSLEEAIRYEQKDLDSTRDNPVQCKLWNPTKRCSEKGTEDPPGSQEFSIEKQVIERLQCEILCGGETNLIRQIYKQILVAKEVAWKSVRFYYPKQNSHRRKKKKKIVCPHQSPFFPSSIILQQSDFHSLRLSHSLRSLTYTPVRFFPVASLFLL